MFPVQASTHAAEVDQMTVLVHWLMLVLFVGWGLLLPVRAVPVPQGREPGGQLHRREGQDLEGARSRRRGDRSVPAGVLRDPGVGETRQGVSGRERSDRRPRRRRAVCVEHSLSRAGREVRPHRHQAGERRQSARPRSHRSGREGRHHDDQSAEPAGRSAGARAPVEQGRHPQLRAVRDAREAGRDSRDEHPGVVHPEPHRRVRDRLLAAVRPRSLPDARVHHHPERRPTTRSGSTRRRKNCSRRRLQPRRRRRASSP